MAQALTREAPATLVTTFPAARAVEATKVYGSGNTAVRALDWLSVEFGVGQFTAIMGPSGSGKSTLLHCLAGLDSLTSGEIYIGDTAISPLNERQRTLLRRDRAGFVFQFFNLIPTLDAMENIELPLALAGNKPDPAWLDTVVETLGLRERLHHRPSELSGGQQQRVAAARALVSKPEIIFADEPTGNLDSKSGGELLGFMKRAVDDLGQTIIMVTHDATAAGYADRVVFLRDGRVVGDVVEPTRDRVIDYLKLMEG